MDATNIALCDMYIEGAKDLDRNQAGKLAFGIVIDLVKDANRTLEDVRRVKSTFLAPERQALIGTPTLEYCKKVCDYLEKLFHCNSSQDKAEILINLAQCVAKGEPCGSSQRGIAITILEEALELNPSFPLKAKIFLLLGNYYAGEQVHLGNQVGVVAFGASLDSEKAIDYYNKAINLDSSPTSLIACYKLAILCGEGRKDFQKDSTRALELFERILSSGRSDIKEINYTRIRYNIAIDMSKRCASLNSRETLRARALLEQCISDISTSAGQAKNNWNIENAKIALAKLLFNCDESIVDACKAETILLETCKSSHETLCLQSNLLLGHLYSRKRPGIKRQANKAKLYFEKVINTSNNDSMKGEAYVGLADLQAEGAIHNYVGALEEVNKAIELGYSPALQKKLYYEAKLSDSLGSAGKTILGKILGG